MDADNVLEEMEALRDQAASLLELLPRETWTCWLRPSTSYRQMTNRPCFVSAKPPCLTEILASLPQLLLKGAGITVALKYSLFLLLC